MVIPKADDFLSSSSSNIPFFLESVQCLPSLIDFVGQARFNSNEAIFIFTLSLWIAPIDNSLRLSVHFLFLYSDMEMFYASQRVRKAPDY